LENTKKARQMLEAAHTSEFAKILLRNFDIPVQEYMSNLLGYAPLNPLENEFKVSFECELGRIGIPDNDKKEIIDFLEKNRTLQTIGHTTLSNGPGFLGANWLASLGSASGDFCIAATWSGLPFNNECRPDSLNFGGTLEIDDFIISAYPNMKLLKRAERQRKKFSSDRRIPIVPENMRRSIVYSSPISDFTNIFIKHFSSKISKYVSDNHARDDFTAFALTFSSSIESEILDRRMVYVDICSIVSKYLYLVFENEDHPITQFCFRESHLEALTSSEAGKMPLFSGTDERSSAFTQFYYRDFSITNGTQRIQWDLATIRSRLKDQKLCPGLFLTYLVVCFINGFQCLGGYNQVEYLKSFKVFISTIELFSQYSPDRAPTSSLTVGRILDEHGVGVYPLDIVFGKKVIFEPQVSFGEFSTPTVIRNTWSR